MLRWLVPMIMADMAQGTFEHNTRVLGLGTCRLRDMILGIRGSESSLKNVEGHKIISGFCHSLEDSIQKLNILKNNLEWPIKADLLIHGRRVSENEGYARRRRMYSEIGQLFEFSKDDLVIVEWSSLKRCTMEGWDINPSYLGHHIVRPGGIAWLDWWSAGSPQDVIVDDFLSGRGEISQQDFSDEDLVSILRGTSIVNSDAEDSVRSLKLLQSLCDDAKLVIVLPHYSPNKIHDIVDANEERLKSIHFVYIQEIVSDIGRERAFRSGGSDLSHFEEEALEAIQSAFYKSLHEGEILGGA